MQNSFTSLNKKHQPDFIVETADTIYMIEVKASNEINTEEVQDKKQAAESYCAYSTAYNLANGNKPWKYVIFPHDRIVLNASWEGLLNVGV
jgi:type III restriction enzyme